MVRIILAILLLGSSLQCFSEEFKHDLKEWQGESLLYIGYGNANLLMHDPQGALDNFQRASAVLDPSDNSSSIIGFLISFGQVIAYDTLGLQEECKQSLGSLFLAINDYSEEDESSETESETNIDPQAGKIAVDFLHGLATLTPSLEIRKLLFSLVDDMADELLPSFQLTNTFFSGQVDWVIGDDQDSFSIELCKKKSWWKKFKKWCHEAAEWISDAVKIVKGAKDLKDSYDKLKNTNNQPNNTNYITPNTRMENLQPNQSRIL